MRFPPIFLKGRPKTIDHEVRYLLPPTQRTRYQTKVFQQSVTVLIKLQQNNTGSGAAAVAERGVVVGPWRVPEEQLPVLVGTITGASLLLLLLLSLLLYTCCHHTPRHKNYKFGCSKGDTQPCQDELIRNTSGKSVKSEVSSMTSGRTQGSGPSLSRDSLVVVTHASSGHQACLLSDRDSPSDYLFDCECCCDPPCPASCTCEYPDDDADDSECAGQVFEEEPGSSEDLPRSLSLPLKEQGQVQKSSDESSEPTNNNSVRAKVSPRPTSNPVAFSPYDLTLPRPPKRDPSADGGVTRTLEGVYLPLGPDLHMDDQSASSSALDTVMPLGRSRDADQCVVDDTFRTRSLPAWVRNKTRPLTTLDDLNTIYEKPHWSKRRRNRMRSDAAAVIALSKSRGRLLSPSPQVTAQTSTSVAAQPDTAALVENEAVIVYDERTAL